MNSGEQWQVEQWQEEQMQVEQWQGELGEWMGEGWGKDGERMGRVIQGQLQ